jgi:hypothetical protein
MSTQLLLFKAKNKEELSNQISMMKHISSEMIFHHDSTEIQVFHIGRTWYYRVLEEGYGLRNRMWKDEITFPSVIYDSRSMPVRKSKEDLANKIDICIHSNNYEIIDIWPKG